MKLQNEKNFLVKNLIKIDIFGFKLRRSRNMFTVLFRGNALYNANV